MAKSEITQVTEAFLLTLTAKERAEQAHEEARQLLLDTYAKHGVSENAHDEVKVVVTPTERRSFSVDKLRKAISPALFRKVTKPSVDTRAWDSAVDKGEIPAKVIRTCVEVTQSVRVTVKPTKGADKPARRTASEVA